jgi:hypothetical protein
VSENTRRQGSNEDGEILLAVYAPFLPHPAVFLYSHSCRARQRHRSSLLLLLQRIPPAPQTPQKVGERERE